jgi:hypothetical protein
MGAAMTSEYRAAAVTRPIAAWPERVHVLFGDDGGRVTAGYYMDRATYRAIPYGDMFATPADYAAHGRIVRAPRGFLWAHGARRG